VLRKDGLLLELLRGLEQEVFLLYLSSDNLRVATEDSVLHLLNLWMMKNSPERIGSPSCFGHYSWMMKKLEDEYAQARKEQEELADDLLVALRIPSLSPTALCCVLPNMYWFKGTEASTNASFLLAASFAQHHNVRDCGCVLERLEEADSMEAGGSSGKRDEMGATFTFTSNICRQELVDFTDFLINGRFKRGACDLFYGRTECYGLGRTWFVSWSLQYNPPAAGAGHLLSLYITSMFPRKGSDGMEVPWLMKGIEVVVGGKLFKLDESGDSNHGGFKEGRQLAVADPLELGPLPEGWSKKDWEAKGLPLIGDIEVKVTIQGMAHAGCKE
jgi:hypothetical protein